ncbi:MAG: cell division protein FtsL [Desulfarculaceae bacterium]|jgi:hypothetical protein
MSVSARVQNRRLAQGVRPASVKLRSIVFLLIAVTAAALYYAFTTMRSLDVSYQVSRALEQQRELREAGRRLQVELNHLRSPQRLEREGARLGLVKPQPEQIRGLE